jgi:hypothetical protein
MTADEFLWILDSLARRTPFQPFMVEFVNGKRILIRHPLALAYWHNIAMFRNPRGAFHLFTAESVCRMADANLDNGEELRL